MSTVSRFVTSSKMTPRALNSALIPFVSFLFLSGIPRVLDPLILWIWNSLFPTPMASYLLDLASVFGWLSIVAGLVKFFASKDLSEKLRIEGDVKTFGMEDLPIIGLYLTFGYAAMSVLGVSLTPVTIVQGGVMLILSLSFVTIPWYLWRFVDIPSQTDALTTKSGVFLTSILLAGSMSVIALVTMRMIEFYL